jgi:hypothetical protein
MVAASSAPHIQARFTWGYPDVPEGGAELAVAEDVLHRGAVPVPVLRRRRLVRGSHVQVGQDERVGVDCPGPGQLVERQGTLVRVQGAPPPGPRVGGDLGRVQRHPADQQPGAGRPPVRAVLRDGDLRIVHVNGVVPGVLGDPGQQPPQRRDPLGAADPDQFITELITDDSALIRYLVREVLNTQPPAVRDVLLSTSILEQVSAEADAVTWERSAGSSCGVDLAPFLAVLALAADARSFAGVGRVASHGTFGPISRMAGGGVLMLVRRS